MVCLDTTFLVDLLRRKSVAEKKLKELWDKGEPITTTPINAAELCEGAYAMTHREIETKRVKDILGLARLLDINLTACETYGSLSSNQASRGSKIGDLDTLIASIALTHGQALLTLNKKDFEKIPGLAIESY
ncbi:MAG TPA: type II toxin-antitoxin system VapC family toxin [Candidatus Binatus sp.]|nr:type II toxin-antitoxin system VapC family toxin [Candidatus Binatus sp.]